MAQSDSPSLHLILGGARSGKSRLAEKLAAQTGLAVCYVATATAGDAEMAARIAKHQNDRPNDWQLIEAPLDLADVIATWSHPDRVLLIDCLTLWLSNALHQGCWPSERENFLAALDHAKGPVLMVSNEVGQGIVPLGELTRQFVDEAGWLHQAIAEKATEVSFVIAGLAQKLKG
ncbi:Bifunctional adenosylcobalamin biosynthesis protein CobP [Vibrio stylophorae]|uniref:Bifunctional adenosylcobalamin biosynthesis protein n=1 Tax=Vibrio stylophorae TaxID=659351 RepID=A0ABN8DTU9_9VIBR|nr:bifunctional adenosylcobinamide kinase/adenosylcobinamide-phosphate guanylyltransferase [Vibrio stylophorae]CAH0533704.1 Bifunctional adenosylcobalamin biosynthesis protein CobP [Vibrio stylophorae]